MPRMTASRHLIGKDSRVISFAVSINLLDRAQQSISGTILILQSVCLSVNPPACILYIRHHMGTQGSPQSTAAPSRTEFPCPPLPALPESQCPQVRATSHSILPRPMTLHT